MSEVRILSPRPIEERPALSGLFRSRWVMVFLTFLVDAPVWEIGAPWHHAGVLADAEVAYCRSVCCDPVLWLAPEMPASESFCCRSFGALHALQPTSFHSCGGRPG
ncbi:protein of unknown function [Acidithiobacillus ferrivorans]|uniref:Uncharacterized protein n=1 Tax=Acidithiobacillus ferrivorans TaxID=160808 RepID=A0ABY1MQH0_9PROT|nr:protein of unknown function [Acidithiobacillus ferrivorans]